MDQSFNRATLARCLISKDFYIDDNLNDETYRRNLIDQALNLAKDGNNFTPNLSVDTSSKKPVYSVNNLVEKLVLRKCAKNIRSAAKIRIKPRTKIIREIKSFLKEGTPYRIYRLDIHSFFENCHSGNIIDIFQKYKISTQTELLLTKFLANFNSVYSAGIPRGIETSPILSELSLIDFDSIISGLEEAYYYSRFVDDIFIITSGEENKGEFLKRVRRALPKGLKLNHNKTTIIDIPKRSKGIPACTVAKLDYLGYSFSVIDTDLSLIYPNTAIDKLKGVTKVEYREVLIDLTSKKINRIMEKVTKAFYSNSKCNDYQLLTDRLVFLSTNRNLINKVKNRAIPTGIYYSHSEIDFPSMSLKRLDNFLNKMIHTPQGRIGGVISGQLSKAQKKQLSKISFSNGHNKRVFKRYSPNRLGTISSIW